MAIWLHVFLSVLQVLSTGGSKVKFCVSFEQWTGVRQVMCLWKLCLKLVVAGLHMVAAVDVWGKLPAGGIIVLVLLVVLNVYDCICVSIV